MTLPFLRSVAILLFVLFGVQGSALAQDLDLAGRYRCDGANPDGTPYRAIVEIAKDGQTYVVRWSSQDPAIGIGILSDNQLSVAYTGGRAIGLVVYRIEKGPRLTGQWTLLGADGQVYRETLTKIGLAAEGRGGSDDVKGVAEIAALSVSRDVSSHSNEGRLVASENRTMVRP